MKDQSGCGVETRLEGRGEGAGRSAGSQLKYHRCSKKPTPTGVVTVEGERWMHSKNIEANSLGFADGRALGAEGENHIKVQ